jgi:hypothetical protein
MITRRALAALGGAVTISAAISPATAFATDGEDRFVPHEGARMHYRSYGTGPEGVIFIRGWKR